MPDYPRQCLFLDYRHIRCGDLQWFTPDGAPLPLRNPPEPPTSACARPRFMPRGVRLQAEPAAQEGPVEGLGGSVIVDGGLYRCWDAELGGEAGAAEVRLVCRESPDGRQWRTAAVSAISVGGQDTCLEGWGFFKDPNGIPSERYKAVYSPRPPKGEWARLWEGYRHRHPRFRDERLAPEVKMRVLLGAVSPDGLQWTLLPEPLMVHMSDTDTTVYYDSALRKYVLYTRRYTHDRRSIGRAESDDFRHWGPIFPCIEPEMDDLTTDIYTNGRTEYPGLPQYHLMFPMFYHRWDQTADIHLYSSADGVAWRRVPGGPVIRTGPGGRWDSEFISSGKNLVPLGTDRVAVPYEGTPYPHKYPRWSAVRQCWPGVKGWASWPRGRLCGVTADTEGEFWTLLTPVGGRRLRLNVRVRCAGEARVGVIRSGVVADSTDTLARVPLRPTEAEGRTVLDCDPIHGDSLAAPVTWRGVAELGIPPGECVSLHVQLRSAKLFGFEWVE